MRSHKSALELLEPTDIRIKEISHQLDQNIRKTLDITGFVITGFTTIYGDTKVIYVFYLMQIFLGLKVLLPNRLWYG